MEQLITLTSSSGTDIVDWETYIDITASNFFDGESAETVVPSHMTHDVENEEEKEVGKYEDIPTIKNVLCIATKLKIYGSFGDGKNIIGVMKIEYTVQGTLAQKNKLRQCNVTQYFKCASE